MSPKKISITNRKLQKLARQYLLELESSQLEVVLIPAPEQKHSTHMVRAVQEQNCDWYREFCEEHPSTGRFRKLKFQTKIKRRQTVKALKLLIEGGAETSYTVMLKEFILRREKR